jgi:hypothetical protein
VEVNSELHDSAALTAGKVPSYGRLEHREGKLAGRRWADNNKMDLQAVGRGLWGLDGAG